MTEQEAIQNLKEEEIPKLGKDGFSNDNLVEAHCMAIAALEKQIPKKPIGITKAKDGSKYVGNIGKCPCCGDIIDEITIRCDCGQAIDWSE